MVSPRKVHGVTVHYHPMSVHEVDNTDHLILVHKYVSSLTCITVYYLSPFEFCLEKCLKIYITEKDDGKNPTMIYQFSIPILSLFSSLFPFANITPCPLYYLPCSNRCGKLFHTKVPCISFPLFANLSLCQFICLYQISKLRGRNCERAKFLIFLLENQNL